MSNQKKLKWYVVDDSTYQTPTGQYCMRNGGTGWSVPPKRRHWDFKDMLKDGERTPAQKELDDKLGEAARKLTEATIPVDKENLLEGFRKYPDRADRVDALSSFGSRMIDRYFSPTIEAPLVKSELLPGIESTSFEKTIDFKWPLKPPPTFEAKLCEVHGEKYEAICTQCWVDGRASKQGIVWAFLCLSYKALLRVEPKRLSTDMRFEVPSDHPARLSASVGRKEDFILGLTLRQDNSDDMYTFFVPPEIEINLNPGRAYFTVSVSLPQAGVEEITSRPELNP